MSNEEAAKQIYRPIDRDLMRLDREQTKLKEAYQIIDDQHEITDLVFSNRLFIYNNEQTDSHRVEARRLKDDYNAYMCDMNRPAAKLEAKYKAPKSLVRNTKFIKI